MNTVKTKFITLDLIQELLQMEPEESVANELQGILKEEELKVMRAKELNTQIQYKLLEQLQKKKKEEATLQYTLLQRKT